MLVLVGTQISAPLTAHAAFDVDVDNSICCCDNGSWYAKQFDISKGTSAYSAVAL